MCTEWYQRADEMNCTVSTDIKRGASTTANEKKRTLNFVTSILILISIAHMGDCMYVCSCIFTIHKLSVFFFVRNVRFSIMLLAAQMMSRNKSLGNTESEKKTFQPKNTQTHRDTDELNFWINYQSGEKKEPIQNVRTFEQKTIYWTIMKRKFLGKIQKSTSDQCECCVLFSFFCCFIWAISFYVPANISLLRCLPSHSATRSYVIA